MEGLIVKNISNDYTVLANNKEYICKPRGKFRNMNISPLVGDNVVFDEDKKWLLDIKPRKNYLIRPTVSNIDIAFIITTVKPSFDKNLLDKLLTIITFNNIIPIICFTKLDLLNNSELEEINDYINYYKKIGYQVYTNTNIELLKPLFKNKVCVFTGQTGSGKSTLLNRLDNNLNIKTDEISTALGRGKHTTRHVELLKMYDGLVADTPGFSSLDFVDMKDTDIRDSFIDFNLYRDKCEYSDCMHINEIKCQIKEELKKGNILQSRYENYLKFIKKGDF